MRLVFFTDRDLGNRFPDILAAAGLTVERHRDHFRPDCPDDEWLEVVGSRAWVPITHDTRIRYKPNELAAVVRHRVRLLVVVGKAPFPDLARTFVATMPRISRFLASHDPPLIAKIYRPSPSRLSTNPGASGDIASWLPEGLGRHFLMVPGRALVGMAEAIEQGLVERAADELQADRGAVPVEAARH